METITKNDLDNLEKTLNAKYDGLEKSLNAKYEGLEKLVNTRFENLEKSITKDIRWIITIVLIIVSIATAFIKYFPGGVS